MKEYSKEINNVISNLWFLKKMFTRFRNQNAILKALKV